MIQINLLRVSPDSQYLEFSVECPADYVFNTLYISHYNLTSEGYDTTIDASTLLGGTTTKEVLRIATSALGTDVTMYKVEFGVTSAIPENPEIENAVGVCSNINFVYTSLLNTIISFSNCTITKANYDLLVRTHIILYSHQEAMRLERYTEAEYFYGLLWDIYAACGGTPEIMFGGTDGGNGITKPCNC